MPYVVLPSDLSESPTPRLSIFYKALIDADEVARTMCGSVAVYRVDRIRTYPRLFTEEQRNKLWDQADISNELDAFDTDEQIAAIQNYYERNEDSEFALDAFGIGYGADWGEDGGDALVRESLEKIGAPELFDSVVAAIKKIL